jgi:hypothetical protein
MASYQSYCLKPDYFTGVSGWANSSTNDQWLIKNRGTLVTYKQITQTRAGDVSGVIVTLFSSTLQYNRDEPHGAFMAFIQKNINIAVTNDRGYSTYFQCKGV